MLVDPADAGGTPAKGIPPRGEAWPDARLAARLGLKVGDTLAVGDATLKVGAIVQQEPEVASGLLAIGPRLLHPSRRRAGDESAATRQPRRPIACSSPICSARDALEPYLTWLQAS